MVQAQRVPLLLEVVQPTQDLVAEAVDLMAPLMATLALAATALSSCSGTSAPLATLGRTGIACFVQRDRTLTGLARVFPAALACGALPALPRVVHALAALL